jgi:hypothetical protein
MPIDIKNFPMHKAVVLHQAIRENNLAGAEKYLDALTSRITELGDDVDAKAGIEELRGYFIALSAVAELARKQGEDLDAYFADLCGQ